MATRSGKFLPVGMRRATVYELSDSGRPKATDTSAYAGIDWAGETAFELSIPTPRVLPHPGRDSVVAYATLPSQDAASGTLRTSDYRYDILAVLKGIPVGSVGEAKEFPHMSDRDGYEPTVGLLLTQQSQDLDTGLLTWHSYVIPKAKITPAPSGMSAAVGEQVFTITPSKTKERLWGDAFTMATDGYTRAGILEYDTEGFPMVIGFLGSGAATVFTFPAGYDALSTDKIAVFVDGVAVSAGVTKAVDKITFGVAPASNAEITVWYELAASLGEEVSV